MRRARHTSVVLLAVATTAACLLTAPGPAGARGDATPSRLLVTASEWSLVLSRAKIDPGPSIIQLHNGGEDPHNLRLQKTTGGAVRRVAEVEPGATGTLEMRLKKGATYRLWCSLPQHATFGMEATLRVKRR